MENENNQLPLEENQENAAMEQPAPVEETAPVEEAAPVELKKGILLTPGKLVGLIVGVVVLVAVLVGAVVAGMGGFGKTDASDPAPTTEATVNWTWNNRLVPNRKRSSSRLYIVTLFI